MKAPPLTLVLGYRERDIARVKNCLDSLQQQTVKEFVVHFVDYGSDKPISEMVSKLVAQYSFCKYFFVDTRGHVWNRSHSLNIGIRLSETEYTMTSDVDVIYAPNFIESILKILSPNHVIYCHPTWLPKDASAQDGNPQGARLDRSKDHKGMCQVVSTKLLHDVCGFDEYYCYWGFEDEDLALRLNRKGAKEFWLNENEETFLFHQWHDESGYRGDGFPAGIYELLCLHYLNVKKGTGSSLRPLEWGKYLTTADRAALKYLDFQSERLIPSDELIVLDLPPEVHSSISLLTSAFDNARAGQALAVKHSNFPVKSMYVTGGMSLLNRIVRRLNYLSAVNYSRNILHSFVSLFVLEGRVLIEDYYFGFPAEDGISIIVKK